ncbi:hypothetical protein EW146_g9611 [Bondarzewia mesenterica]|uniref:F-box domain-containing protein n=1 Tax=Bondarzewia mesenterica TaxID=1095465 RepID=A0A4S4L5A3_9AGAM|nr:hypothetical protein EW146_g9611 [Bondarzewia mesenterica]
MPTRRSKKCKTQANDHSLDGSNSLSGVGMNARDYPTLPLELLLEILSYLRPQDLLQLSRSSHWLRSVLLRRQNASIWTRCINNVDRMPPCPEYLTQPHYASLVCEFFCQNCLANETCHAVWVAQARYCQACSKELFISRPRCPKNVDKNIWERAMRASAVTIFSPRLRYEHTEYHKPVTDALRECLPALSPVDQGDYIYKFRQDILSLRKDSSRYVLWVHRQYDSKVALDKIDAKKKREEEQAIIRVRADKIVSRMQKLGYKELAIPSVRRSFSAHNLVQIPRELNGKGHLLYSLSDIPQGNCTESHSLPVCIPEWKQIKSTLSKRVEHLRSANADSQRKDVLTARLKQLISLLDDVMQNLPDIASNNYIDIILLPEVRKMVDAPGNDALTTVALTKLRKTLPSLWTHWQEMTASKLAHSFEVIRPIFEKIKTLDHPAVIFFCSSCFDQPPLTFPGLFKHRCLNRRVKHSAKWNPTMKAKISLYEFTAKVVCERAPWSCKDLELHRAAERVKDMMTVCGVDPDTTTWADMARRDVRVCCLTCEKKGRDSLMNWRMAVEHAVHSHVRGMVEWEAVGEGDI